MSDIDLKVAFNRLQRISYTRGEDRELSLLISDDAEGLPVDLNGAQLIMAFPRDGGGFIKRRTAGLTFSWAKAQTLNGLTVIPATGHGMVSGDMVTLTPDLSGSVPGPFNVGERYVIYSEDVNSFGLYNLNGNAMVLDAPSSISSTLVGDDFAVGNTAIGQAFLKLQAHVTAASATGQGLSYQLTYTNLAGLTRIYAATNQLDVFAQPCP